MILDYRSLSILGDIIIAVSASDRPYPFDVYGATPKLILPICVGGLKPWPGGGQRLSPSGAE